jgi:hypothetical protein
MINFDHESTVHRLRRKPNIVRSTAKVLMSGFTAFALYNGAFSCYTQQKQQQFIMRADSVLGKTEVVLTAVRTVLDTLQQERQQRTDGIDQLLSESRNLRQQIQQFLNRDPCGQTYIVLPEAYPSERPYRAVQNDCELRVTMPVGGTLVEASELYFRDSRRWQRDWTYRPNAYLRYPGHVEPGDVYTFSLRNGIRR